jgi:E3 ubiquitin-protein ligase DOA10
MAQDAAEVEPVEEELCRYCFEGEDDEAGELLRDICACAGGQRCVHLSCLRRWQRMVLVSQPTHPAFYQDD